MSEYLPVVAWSTLAGNVTLGASAYRYYITVNPLDPNEAGASPMTVAINDWFIDFAGYPFLIEEVNGSVLTVYDILERGDGVVSAYAPYANKLGYVYRPLNGAIILTQAQLRKLDASAADIIQPIEKGVIYNQLLQLNQANPQTVYGGIPIFSTGLETDFVDFNLLTEALGQEGRLKWNTEDGTLEVGLPGGNVNLQIGQEHVLRVYNEDTVTITNGRVVYASSASGNIKKVKLANNNVYEEATHVVGVATEDIASGHFGYIATIGLVRDMDTNGGSVGGQFAYLGLNGEITTTEPEAPNTKVIVGVIVRPHATEGILYVNINVVPRLQDLSDVHGTPSNGQVPQWNTSTSRFEFTTISGGSGTPGGSDTYVQFNDGGSFGGDSGLVFNKTSKALTCTGVLKGSNIETNSTTYNTKLGISALGAITTGLLNLCTGDNSGKSVTEGSADTFLGARSGYSTTTGGGNTFSGFDAGYYNISGEYSTYNGYRSGYNAVGSRNVFYGANSGFYETGSDKLFIDNRSRGNEATSRTDSLIYGIFNSTAASQELHLNSKIYTRYLTNAIKTNKVYYDSSTKELSYYSDAFAALTDGATVTWNCTTGLNKTLTTSRTSFTLSITNASNGMKGELLVLTTTNCVVTIPSGYSKNYTNGDYPVVQQTTLTFNASNLTATVGFSLEWSYDGTRYYYNAKILRNESSD